MAGIFLFLISLADFVAPLLPRLGSNFKTLPRHEAAVLEWYQIVYIIFVIVVFPPMLFVRPLIDRRFGRPSYFSPITCYLGLLLWLMLAPTAIWILPKMFGAMVK